MANTTKQQVLASLIATHVIECNYKIKNVEDLLQVIEFKAALIRKASQENRPFRVQYECVELIAVIGKAYLDTSLETS